MNWLIPENELDREQRKFLESLITQDENEQIVGFPGSGKSILLLYAAKSIKKNQPDAKIIFVEFTHALIKMIEAALLQLQFDDIKVVTYYDFFDNNNQSYDYILCDEVQDVPKRVIDKMKQHAKRVIIAGDPNQSIYENDPKWELPPCTQDEIEATLTPYVTSLSVIHRLSRFVMNSVDRFLPDMKIMSGKVSMVKKHPKIRLWKASSQLSEVREIMKDAKSYMQVDDSIGILLPTHSKIQKFANLVLTSEGKPKWELENDDFGPKYDLLNKHFEECGLPIQYVANGFGDFTDDKTKITLTTYHSSKGLDFDRVYLPFCNHVEEYSKYTDEFKVLFMVAMTRSRGDLVISYSAKLNRFVEAFQKNCTYRDLDVIHLFDDLLNDNYSSSTKQDSDLFGW